MKGVTALMGRFTSEGTAGQPASRYSQRVLLAGSAIVGVAGFIAHLLQTSDPTPTVTYYSPDVALLLGLASGACLVPWRAARARAFSAWIRDAATAGVLFSTLVYWFALVPVNGLPAVSDPAAIVAAFAIHGVLPALAIPAHLRARVEFRDSTRSRVLQLLPFVVYGLAIAIVFGIKGWAFPYEFMDPDVVGLPLAIGFGLVTVAAYTALCLALGASRDRFQRSR